MRGIVALCTGVGSSYPSAAARSFVEQQMRLARLPSVAVAVVRPDAEIYAEGFARQGSPPTPDTPFLLGSTTKTFTALAVAQLVDRGELAFDDPVGDRLSGFALRTGYEGRPVTVRHLLTHTSGLRQWSGHDARAQRDAAFEHITPARPPGLAFEYSSLNYIILGRLVSALSGLSYAEYVQRHIFGPLDMRNSFAELESARRHGLAQGHRFVFGLTLPGRESPQPGPLVPAGFLASTTRDLGHYLRMLLDDGRFRGRQIVSPDTLRAMFRPWDGGATGAGMGWGIGRSSIGHSGSTPTFSTRLTLLPHERYGVVVLASVNSGPFFSGVGDVSEGLVRLVHGQPAPPARPDEILFKVAMLILVLWGTWRAAAGYRRWANRGFPRQLTASRATVTTLATEAAGIALVLFAIPRWVGVPFLAILEYFPDLGLTMAMGVLTGGVGALTKAFVAVDDEARLREQQADEDRSPR
jgi:CubicO group peptidase (beta-lactamase class C family)